MQEIWVQSLVWKVPLAKEMATQTERLTLSPLEEVWVGVLVMQVREAKKRHSLLSSRVLLCCYNAIQYNLIRLSRFAFYIDFS